MTQQQREVNATIQSMAEEQVLFLKNRYKMNADEIISLYTGEKRADATYTDAIRSMIDVTEERDIDSLFTGGKTTALTNTISGLDDFELIAFLVIQEVG